MNRRLRFCNQPLPNLKNKVLKPIPAFIGGLKIPSHGPMHCSSRRNSTTRIQLFIFCAARQQKLNHAIQFITLSETYLISWYKCHRTDSRFIFFSLYLLQANNVHWSLTQHFSNCMFVLLSCQGWIWSSTHSEKPGSHVFPLKVTTQP